MSLKRISPWILLLTLPGYGAEPNLKTARMAFQFGASEVLILGGIFDITDEPTYRALVAADASAPKLGGVPSHAPAELLDEIPFGFSQKLKLNPRMGWKVGDRWQLYPGAGPVATIVIEKLVVLSQAGLGGDFSEGALARFANPSAANRMAGLRATAFLAAPGDGLSKVSEEPVLPLPGRDGKIESDIRAALFARARQIVQNEDWMTAPFTANDEALERIRQLNRAFLGITYQDAIELKIERWAPAGGDPLLFVTAIWRAGARAVFAAEAILDGRDASKLRAFDTREGESMRLGEFRDATWALEDLSHILNAWRIGGRTFIMKSDWGYETLPVAGLWEFDPAKGLILADFARELR